MATDSDIARQLTQLVRAKIGDADVYALTTLPGHAGQSYSFELESGPASGRMREKLVLRLAPEGVRIAGTADVPGAEGSSIRKRMLGGTTRPGTCGGGLGGAGFGTAAGAAAIGVSRTAGAGSAAAITGGGATGSTCSGAAGASIFSSR